MSDNDKKLMTDLMPAHEITQSGDAVVWTDQFVARFGDKWSEPDEELWGLMIGWFANAIAAGERIGRESGKP